MTALTRAFRFLRLNDDDDSDELVAVDSENGNGNVGPSGSVYNPQQSVGPVVQTVQPSRRLRIMHTPVEMFRVRHMALAFKVLSCLLAIIQLFPVFAVSFGYYDYSNCLLKCRLVYDKPHDRLFVPTAFYDDSDEFVQGFEDTILKPTIANDTTTTTTTTTSTTTTAATTSEELTNHSTPSAANNRTRRSLFASHPFYWRFDIANDGDQRLANFSDCQADCDSYILPMQAPLIIYIIHACFTCGLALKNTYSSVADVVGVFSYYAIDTVLLFIAWITLIYVKVNNRESEFKESQQFAYHRHNPDYIDDILVACIVLATVILILHIAQALNHQRPPKRASFSVPSLNDKFVYRSNTCNSQSWFAPSMKFVVCFLSLLGALLVALFAFKSYYVDGRGRYHYKNDAEFQAFAMFPASIWHAMVCFMVLPWSGRYHNPCQVQLTLAFFIIELLIQLFFTLLFAFGSAIFGSSTLAALLIHVINLAVWIVDFAMHRFPGHECCNLRPFDA